MAFSSLILSLALAQAAPGPLEVNEQNFDKMRELIRAKGPDLMWRDLSWQTDLMKFPTETAKKGSAALLWLAEGDPRDQTDTTGVKMRRMVFSDPMVNSQARGFALFLGDLREARGRQTWLPAPLTAEFAKRGSGLYAVAPRGKLLGFTSATNASDVSKWMSDMLSGWNGLAGVERQWSEELAAMARLSPPTTPPKQVQPPMPNRGRAGGGVTVRDTGPQEVRGGPVQEDTVTTVQGRPTRANGGTASVTPGTNANSAAAAAPFATDLSLRFTQRDLPRSGPFVWSDLYNMGTFVLAAGRQAQIMPGVNRSGEVVNWPTDLVRDMATTALNDNVRGHALTYTAENISVARMSTKVHSSYGNTVLYRYYGSVTASAEGNWALAPGEEPKMDELQSRGVDLSVYGRSVYDTKLKKFLQFDLVFVGKRHGGSPKNLRREDTAPQPIGIMATTAGQMWFDQTKPAAVQRSW
ncbi:MAG: hypothetical protein JNJ45_02440 [Chthonomonas sp.]|nr:hypothetical protein [Chthonomonas sp.]